MNEAPFSSVSITGMGMICSVGHSVPQFVDALREGRCGIVHLPDSRGHSVRVAGLIQGFSWERSLEQLRHVAPELASRARKLSANMTESTRLSAWAAMEAFLDARLDKREINPARTGLIVAGCNLSQDYVARNWARFAKRGRPEPRYALSFSDSHQVGCLSEIFSIGGPGMTVGAAAASGNAALFQAFHWVRTGVVQTCLVVGACTGFSMLELEGFAVLGATACGPRAADPSEACRPFDEGHEGFVWGQGSACVVLEASRPSAEDSGFASLVGASLLLDANHLPEPSVAGEIRAMQAALELAGLAPEQIGYINAHGSSAPLGDRTEAAAIRSVFQRTSAQVRINSTKSLTGHCFSASGVIELIASVLQLRAGFIHPNRNLECPIDPELRFAGITTEPLDVDFALSNGFGFGGFNSSIVIRKAAS